MNIVEKGEWASRQVKMPNIIVGLSMIVSGWLKGNGTEQMEQSTEHTVLLKRDGLSAKNSRWRMNAEVGWSMEAEV